MNTSQTAYSSSTRKTSSSDIPAIIIIASDIHPQMHMQQHQAPPAATRAVGSARPALLLAKVPAARGKTRSRGSAGAAGHTCPLRRAWVLTPTCAARHGRKELPARHVALAARPVIPLGAESLRFTNRRGSEVKRQAGHAINYSCSLLPLREGNFSR